MMPFVYSWNRRCGLVASKPLSQPSPVSGSTHRVEPVNESVPLSCVPDIAVSGEYGLTEMLYIWRSPSPAFMTFSSVGILLSQLWQSARFCPVSGSARVSHWADASAYLQLVRMTPPSAPKKNGSGSPETNASACWSGCIDSPPTSPVMSVQFTPASDDMSTARPFERWPTTWSGGTWLTYGFSSS